MMIALYSINLTYYGVKLQKFDGRPNIPLLNSETIFSQFQGFGVILGIDAALNNTY